MEASLHNIKGEEIGKIVLNDKIWNIEPNISILHKSIKSYLSSQHLGTADTKTRKEVRGGGKKPWRQKHTGRARHGSTRSPIWKGGGTTFGPHPRSHKKRINKKEKKLALHSALSEKLKEKNILIIENLSIEEPKTKLMKEILKNLNIKDALIVLSSEDSLIERASKNLQDIKVIPVKSLNTYDVLLYNKILFTKESIEETNRVFA